jgi:hypothetical protein
MYLQCISVDFDNPFSNVSIFYIPTRIKKSGNCVLLFCDFKKNILGFLLIS